MRAYLYAPFLISLLFVCYPALSHAQKYASIIIDDLGNNISRGKAVVNFPAPVTLAILPRTEYAARLAKLAHHNDKEIMLHLPLQSIENHDHSPGTLNLHMTHEEFLAELKHNIDSVPHIKGINNHMGSLLTRHPGHMTWLMKKLAEIGDLYFLDSRTSSKTVANKIAQQHNIPSIERDIFLDPDYEPSTIKKQFSKFIDLIKRQGYAIAIAHPHPRTLKFIEENLSTLKQQGIELVTVSELIELRTGESHVTCIGATCSGL